MIHAVLALAVGGSRPGAVHVAAAVLGVPADSCSSPGAQTAVHDAGD